MKVVLHIGTHKTGTSYIQSVLARNRDKLLSLGIHYPKSPRSYRNHNFIGAEIGRDVEFVESYVTAELKRASRYSADMLLLSAESLYAMTSFFDTVEKYDDELYKQSELKKIRELKRILSGHDVSVVCYVRPHASFADSLYNQFVKQTIGFCGQFGEFLEAHRRVFDYVLHLDMWSDVFGRDALKIMVYDPKRHDVFSEFAVHQLYISDTSKLEFPSRRINERLPYDLLEFKRALNAFDKTRSESYVAYRIVSTIAVSNQNPDFINHKFIAEKTFRNLFLSDAVRLGDTFNIVLSDDPPDRTGRTLENHIGVSAERVFEIYDQFHRELNRPIVIFEIFLRNSIRRAMSSSPYFQNIFKIVKKINDWFLLKSEWR